MHVCLKKNSRRSSTYEKLSNSCGANTHHTTVKELELPLCPTHKQKNYMNIHCLKAAQF